MTLPTAADFNNAKRDLDDLAEIVTSPAVKDVPNRAGGNTPTLTKVMGETTDFLATQTQRLAVRDAEIDQALVRLRDHAPVRNRGVWVTGTTYEVNDIWQAASDVWYVVVQEYVSGETDVADIAGGNVFVHQVNIVADIPADTIADLRLFEPGQDKQHKNVVGHNIAGLGGGVFWHDASDTTTPDDDGTVIRTAAGDKCWKRKAGGVVDSHWFGIPKVFIYVSAGGNDLNTGFSVTSPLLTLQKAFDTLASLGVYFSGNWAIKLSAGTYTESGASLKSNMIFENRLEILGPDVGGHPNTPTAVIDGSAGSTGQHAITINDNSIATIKDIKAVNFNYGDSSTGAFLAQNGADVLFDNCHATGSSWFGCYVTASSKGRVRGGIYDGNRENIAFNASEGTVGYQATSLLTGPISRNATERGVAWTRGTQGHVDFVAFEDNTVGLAVDRNSRCADVKCDFKRNATAIQTRAGGVINGDKDNGYNIGGIDANTTIFDFGAFSGAQEEFLDRSGIGFTVDARSEILIARDLSLTSHSGDTDRTVVMAPFSLPAGYFVDGGLSSMIGPKLRFRITGARTNGGSGGLCSIGIQFGGSNINQWNMVGTIENDWMLDAEVWSVGPTTQKIIGTLTQANGTSPVIRHFGVFTRSIDMTVVRDIEIDLQVADATDTITIESLELFRLG